jgi:SAM-dependent methyltransferase
VSSFYAEDLAHIHDAGFSELSRRAGAQVLTELAAAGIRSGLIVDLGCGSGAWSAMAVGAGFSVLGIDVSEAMLRLSRSAAPGANFVLASLYSAAIPPCVAVTAFGEALNYGLPDPPARFMLEELVRRVSAALAGGGLFVFDVLVKSDGLPMRYRSWSAGPDYAVLIDVSEQTDQSVLCREITLFRKIGESYRRSQEQHTLRVFDAGLLQSFLLSAGFEVDSATRYGEYGLEDRRRAFITRKQSN